MREMVLRSSSVCSLCGEVIDRNLPSLCRNVRTESFAVHEAHLIPLDCSPECRKLKHPRKSNPWAGSVDHIIPVSQLPPGSPLLTDPKNGRPCHLVCNIKRQAGENDKPEGPPLLKSWL